MSPGQAGMSVSAIKEDMGTRPVMKRLHDG